MEEISVLTENTGNQMLPVFEVTLFKNAMHGPVLGTDDADYDERRAVWNGMIDRKPALIACCKDTDDVATAVKFARKHHLRFSIRSGGHHVTGKAVCDKGLMIDLSDMRQVTVDPVKQIATVGGGATLGDVDRETQHHSLAVPLGAVSRTGVAGLTLHGGYGRLSRKYGLASDNLLAAEVVTSRGKIVRASKNQHEDLYWALRGGGGNFGIVTSFEFQAHPVGQTMWGLLTIYPADCAKDGLKLMREQIENDAEELMVVAVLWTAPDEEFIPKKYRGQPAFIFFGNYAGPLKDGERALAPFRTMAKPIADLSAETPFVDLQQILDPDYPDGRQYYWKSAYLGDLDDRAIDAIVARAAERPSPLSSIDVWSLGGKIGRTGLTSTAFAQRESKYLIGIEANWLDPKANEANITWAKNVYDDIVKIKDVGQYLNFPGFGEEGQDALKKAYGPNYIRLKQVKTKWDPDNFFKGFIEL